MNCTQNELLYQVTAPNLGISFKIEFAKKLGVGLEHYIIDRPKENSILSKRRFVWPTRNSIIYIQNELSHT